jgi:hypothetical protein
MPNRSVLKTAGRPRKLRSAWPNRIVLKPGSRPAAGTCCCLPCLRPIAVSVLRPIAVSVYAQSQCLFTPNRSVCLRPIAVSAYAQSQCLLTPNRSVCLLQPQCLLTPNRSVCLRPIAVSVYAQSQCLFTPNRSVCLRPIAVSVYAQSQCLCLKHVVYGQAAGRPRMHAQVRVVREASQARSPAARPLDPWPGHTLMESEKSAGMMWYQVY